MNSVGLSIFDIEPIPATLQLSQLMELRRVIQKNLHYIQLKYY